MLKGGMGNLMKQAQKMQEQMAKAQEELARAEEDTHARHVDANEFFRLVRAQLCVRAVELVAGSALPRAARDDQQHRAFVGNEGVPEDRVVRSGLPLHVNRGI